MYACAEYGRLDFHATNTDINTWFAVWDTLWFLLFVRIGISLASGICILYCIKGFIRWHRAKTKYGIKTSPIALSCLFLQLLANLIRVVYFAVDPLMSERVYPWVLQTQLLTISIPIGLCATVLIVFYWAELMFAHFGASPITFVSKYKIPAFLTILLILGTNIVRVVLDVQRRDTIAANTLLSVVYMVSQVILAISFVVLGRRLIKFLLMSNRSRPRSSKYRSGVNKLKRISLYVMCSACTMILSILGFAFSLIGSIFNNPLGMVLTFTIAYYFIIFTSLLEIFVFSCPPIPSDQSKLIGVKPSTSSSMGSPQLQHH